MSAASPSASSAGFAEIHVDPACVVERCVLFITGVTLLLALLVFSSALFALFIGRIQEGSAAMAFVLVLMSVYGLAKLCCRVATTRVTVVVGLTVALLFYSLLTLSLTVTNWLAATFLWLVSFTLWLATIRAFRAIRRGALDVFLAVARFKRKYGRNGSFMKYALRKGLSSDGVWYFCAAIASMLLIPVFREYFPQYPYTTPVLVAIAWWCYREGGTRGLAQSIRSSPETPLGFTFYLRSFLDDAAEVAPLPTKSKFEGVISALFGGQYLDAMLGYGRNLEEAAVAALWPFDPVLCLGHSSSQPLGALRFDVFDNEWQVMASRLFHSAARILLMVSFTSGLAWELREIFSQQLQRKLILLVPPELPTQKAARWRQGSLAVEQLLTRWNESIRDTPLSDIRAAQLESAVALRFGEDGHPISLISSSRTTLAYSVALRVACLPVAELMELSVASARA